jgi:hypothetical protein
VAETYRLEGRILETCSCFAPCPCWVADDPDNGYCDSFNAYHIDQGHIKGVDVSGLTVMWVCYIPGNVLAGNWSWVLIVDSHGTPEQQQLLLDALGGEIPGPFGDAAGLVSDKRGTMAAPIKWDIHEGTGTLEVGEGGKLVRSKMAPFRGPNGDPTTLYNHAWTTIGDAPAYLAKYEYAEVDVPLGGYKWSYTGRNAIMGHFRFVSE